MRGLMRDVVNNQDVDKYTKMIRKYCSVREMRIRGRGKTRQRLISPLHDPGRDNVKQGQNGKQEKLTRTKRREETIKEERGDGREVHQSCDGSRDRHSN
jgi:hypothetical protein